MVNNKNQLEELAATRGVLTTSRHCSKTCQPAPCSKSSWVMQPGPSVQMANDEPDMSAEDRIPMAAVTLEDTVETNLTAVDANLAQLMLRFHGLSLDTDAPVLSKYRWLFESVTHTTNDRPKDGDSCALHHESSTVLLY